MGKSKTANKRGSVFLVQYNGTWASGKWDGAGVLTYPGGFEIKGRFEAGKPYYVIGVDPSTGATMFGGKLGSAGFQNIASGDLLQPCSASSGTGSPSSPPTTTPPSPCTNCTTIDGRRCQFPFFIDGKEYNSCTLDLTAEGTTTPWCATRVDGVGNWLSRQGSDSHGSCNSDCPVDTPACSFRGAGFSADVNTRTPGGATFAGHSTGHSMQSITNGGDWDVVVLQGQSQKSSFGSGYVNHYIVPETV